MHDQDTKIAGIKMRRWVFYYRSQRGAEREYAVYASNIVAAVKAFERDVLSQRRGIKWHGDITSVPDEGGCN